MLATERQKKIGEIVREYRHIDVSSLSSILNVTEATIRKDLEKLEQSGVLTRIHGGAVSNNTDSPSSFLINDPYAKDKSAIAKLASELIEPGEVVFLGAGSINYFIAKHLSDIGGLNVITNNVAAISELSANDNINLVALGGEVKRSGEQPYMCGRLATENLAQFHINKAFLTFDGIHNQIGYTLSDSHLLDLYKIVEKASEELISVADSSRYSKISMLNFCGFTDIKKVIVSKDLSDEYKKQYFESGIQLFSTVHSEIDI